MFLVGLFWTIFNIVSSQWGQGVIWRRGKQGKGDMSSQFFSASVSVRHGDLWNRQSGRDRGCSRWGLGEEGKGGKGTASCRLPFIFFYFFFHFTLRKVIAHHESQPQLYQLGLQSLPKTSPARQVWLTLPELCVVQILSLAINLLPS